jgi:hypothetical protein
MRGTDAALRSARAVKRVLAAAILALLCCVSLCAQQRADVVIAILPVTGTGGAPGDNVFFEEMTAMEVMARGFALAEDGGQSDYAFAGSLGELYPGAKEFFFHLAMTDSADGRTVVEQEIVYKEREDVYEQFPLLVFTMLGNIPMTKLVGGEMAAPEKPPEYWLYVGARMGSSLRFYTRKENDPFVEDEVFHWYNIHAAIHASYNFWRFLSIQGEAIISSEYAPYRVIDMSPTLVSLRAAPFTAGSLMFPLTLKATLRKEPLLAVSAFAGLYVSAPLGDMLNDKMGGAFGYSYMPPFGYTAGVNAGIKAGPGYVFLDLRWAQDMGDTIKTGTDEHLYSRSMVVLAVGFEKGFFLKKR